MKEVTMLVIRTYYDARNETEFFVPSLRHTVTIDGDNVIKGHTKLLDSIYGVLDLWKADNYLEKTLLDLGWSLLLSPFVFRQPEHYVGNLRKFERASGFSIIKIDFAKYYGE